MSNDRAIGRAARVASATDWQPVRGLRREGAAFYIGVSPTKFDQLVADGRMPKPIRIDGRRVWDLRQLDVAFEALISDDGDANPWD